MDFLICSTWRRSRLALVTALLVAAADAGSAFAETAGEAALLAARGRALYETGVAPDGVELAATSVAGQTIKGASAACRRCHRRSGMGMFEGNRLVPAITGPALFEGNQPLRRPHAVSANTKFKDLPSLERPNYDEQSLARAIRDGVRAGGATLDVLMPRYAIGDAELAALTAYLRMLSAAPSPGMDAEGPRFATVVTPDANPERARYMADVLKSCFRARFPDDAGTGSRWTLDVWQLEGEEAAWGAELDAALAARPVFALISGLGNGRWQPVHAFCEKNGVPCFFPNVAVPGGGLKEETYSFYFSGGVLLEARVGARYLGMTAAERKLTRIVQVTAKSDAAGSEAAREFKAAIAAGQTGLDVLEREVDPASAESLAAGFAGLGPTDAVMLWLDAQAVAALAPLPAPSAGLVLLSGAMAGVENAPVPASWRGALEMIYPYDAPQRRDDRMAFNLRPWLKEHGLPATDEILAGNTLAACNVVVESVARMRGFNHRDFLVERVEDYPSGMGNAPAPQAFPRFEAGVGQRFSSRGAYIARFSASQPGGMELVHDWIVP